LLGGVADEIVSEAKIKKEFIVARDRRTLIRELGNTSVENISIFFIEYLECIYVYIEIYLIESIYFFTIFLF
jgi:hypothetical protein